MKNAKKNGAPSAEVNLETSMLHATPTMQAIDGLVKHVRKQKIN